MEFRPSGNPPSVTVNWPSHVTIVQPTQFSKVANEIASLFALASTRLHQIRGARPMNDWVSALLVTFQLVMLVLLLTAQIP